MLEGREAGRREALLGAGALGERRARFLRRLEGGVAALLGLLHELLQRLMNGLQRARQALVARAALLAHRHEIAMHGIETLLAGWLHRPADEARCLARGLARDLLEHVRGCVEALDQLDQLVLDRADAGELRFSPAKLLTYLGKLLLDRSEIFKLGGLPERLAELACDLVEPCVQRLDRVGRHDRAERVLELLRHVDQALVESAALARKRRKVE